MPPPTTLLLIDLQLLNGFGPALRSENRACRVDLLPM
jgi:hypothetical protein